MDDSSEDNKQEPMLLSTQPTNISGQQHSNPDCASFSGAFNSEYTSPSAMTPSNNTISPTNTTSPPTTEEPIAHNQPNPDHIKNLQKGLRSAAQRVNCPYCQNYISTDVKTRNNPCNILCCIFTLYIPWSLHKCCTRKDYNCLDAEHKCPSCGSVLANYKAC
jgi:hypothetical protein